MKDGHISSKSRYGGVSLLFNLCTDCNVNIEPMGKKLIMYISKGYEVRGCELKKIKELTSFIQMSY